MDAHKKIEYNENENLDLPIYTYNPASVYIALRELFPDSYTLIDYLFNTRSHNINNSIKTILNKRDGRIILEYFDKYQIMRDSFLTFLSNSNASGVYNNHHYVEEVSGIQGDFNTIALEAIELSKSNDSESHEELAHVLHTALVLYLELNPTVKFHDLFLKDEHATTQQGGRRRTVRKQKKQKSRKQKSRKQKSHKQKSRK